MILQVLTDAGQLVRDRDAVLLQQHGGADAGELQDLRGADRAGSHHGLDACLGKEPLAATHELNAGSTPVLDAQSRDLRIGDDGEILAVRDRMQERLRRIQPYAAPLVDLEFAGALVVAAVEVLRARNAGLDHRGAERVQDLPFEALLLHAPFAAGAVCLVRAAPVILAALEERQHVVP